MATANAGTQAPTNGTPDRATIVAELEALTDAAAAVEPAASTAAVSEPSSTGEAAAAPVATDKAAAASPADPAPDADTSKRLQVIKQAEERSRKALAQEKADAIAEIQQARQDLERMQTEWKPKLESFERLKARAKYEPAAVLSELGLTDEDFEFASKDAFLRSKAAAADPKSKAELARATKEREHGDEIAVLKRELAETRKLITERDQRGQHERAVNEYLDSAVKAASDETPLLRTLVEKNPTRARAELEKVAFELAEQHGAPVTAAEVALAFEERRRADLEQYGVDLGAIAKKKPATPAPPAPRPGASLPAAPSGTTQVKTKQTREELIAQTLRDLESGNIPAE